MTQAQAVIDAFDGIVRFDCAVCSKECTRHVDGYRCYKDHWCANCRTHDYYQLGDELFLVYHFARRNMRRLWR